MSHFPLPAEDARGKVTERSQCPYRRAVRSARDVSSPALAALAVAVLNGAPVAAEGAVETGRFGEWSLNSSEGSSSKLCFAATEPKSKEPAGANRTKTVFYVSAWPKEGVKSEISVKLGYPIKSGSQVTVTVGKDAFKLFAKEERAFVADSTQELKLIEAMKKESKMIVQATSERGTATSDTYSLAGLTQALTAMATSCR